MRLWSTRITPGASLVDFGSRGTHGIGEALKLARATCLAGGDGTSNGLAARCYGVRFSEPWRTATFKPRATSWLRLNRSPDLAGLAAAGAPVVV